MSPSTSDLRPSAQDWLNESRRLAVERAYFGCNRPTTTIRSGRYKTEEDAFNWEGTES